MKLDKDVITEELNKIIDRYFEEKFQEFGLKSGDITPEMSIIIDDAIEKIADVIAMYIKLNR